MDTNRISGLIPIKIGLKYLCLILLFTACVGTPQPTGALEGHVNIGPLTPVVRQGQPEPTPPPEVYAERKVVIFDASGQKEIIRVDIDSSGNYRVALPAGSYTVDINHLGIDRGLDLPQTVEITAEKTTRLDIEIDTGIR